MGLIHVPVCLKQTVKSRKKYQGSFLVDTGAMDCIAPGNELRKAGIQKVAKMAYELADGSIVEYDFGLAVIEFMGVITSGRVIFGPAGSEPLLGVTALESVGIMVDPVGQRLKKLPTVPLK